MGEKRKHAILSASSAKRWIACTPSARLEETFPDSTSEFAEEGTLAHEICELKLSKLFTDQTMTDRTFKTRLNKLKKHELYSPEMDGFTDDYVEYVSKIAYGYPSSPYVSIEKQLDYSNYAPEGFGTADCIVIHGNTCHVIDFKYGKGVPVTAEGNPQMALYALGVLNAYSCIYLIEKVVLTVIQPRLNNYSEWETTASELTTWGDVIVKPKADLAFKGEGDFRQGDHCRFCRASAVCREQKEEHMKLVSYEEKLPPLLTDHEVGEILEKAQNLASWVAKLREYALEALLKGKEIKGWKVVEGRSSRKITDTRVAYEALINAGIDDALLYNRVPISLTSAEKLIGKDLYNNILVNYIEKPKGAPTIALETDKRPVYQANNNVEADFSGDNAYKED